MTDHYIYGLKSVDNDIFMYIGKTINPSQRLKQHKMCRTKNHVMRDWLQSNPVEMIIIERCSECNWEEKEKYWIAYFGLGNLLNIHEGGRVIFKRGQNIVRVAKHIYKKIELIDTPTISILDSLIDVRKQSATLQTELAKHIGITRTTLSRYESKQRDMPFNICIRYAEYFGYEIRLLKK